MLHLIDRRLARVAYRFAHGLRLLYWRLRRPTIYGCAVIARNGHGEVLLVQPSYGGSLWQFPGGGMNPREQPLDAAQREFSEEAGLVLKAARSLGPHRRRLSGATNIVYLVVGEAEGHPRIDRREIVRAEWFGRTALPEGRKESVDDCLRIAGI